ncbi:asparagine synthetase [glutamine-hydrolyzing] [Geminocystis sp. NIES-3708]|uniref:asparagine synthase (glutamine-hydrolyzing) n=1 Tax=Geminocystis sp. NIES-3708 TaxID=1615909 RepID=UPI0005FC6BF5|nr:asparagine synthase (glutamine-hydrolyzing) [Geminocystis sp. NIES-3708]BAQ61810.1 asparagine synthetase [glutamine-hydrolyzing] [Geminocystis sp. NIES-3708]
MCGITGILQFQEKANRQDIQLMTNSLSHRGPDGDGIWINGQVAIGHRRLAIIDLDTGGQPLCNEDETIWITFNGEIYNYQELRQQLVSKGHRFKTNSDTEVIVHSYEEWGDSCVQRFRGMFAFGIVDLNRQKVFIARDPLGIKPLYYIFTDTFFAFASEIQALRQLSINLDIDLQAIDQYLWLKYIPAPKTIFQQIKKLLPAHYINITFGGAISESKQYWHLDFKPNNTKNEADWLEEFDFVFKESVKAHLESDVPFGAFLSGGVDSSAIVAYMSQLLEQPVKTFSIGFDEADFNELQYAEIVAQRWKTDHHTEIVKLEALEELLPKLVKHYGEPFGDSSAIPTYYVSKMARQQVTMVLSGDGGDELFAGYNNYLDWMYWLHKYQEEKPRWEKITHPFFYRFWKRDHYPYRIPDLQTWFRHITQMSSDDRLELWRREHNSIVNQPINIFEEEYKKVSNYNWNQKAQYLDIKTYMPSCILTKVDIASMMNGLEVRTPIVDTKVFEFAGSIPESFNIGRNDQGIWEGKLLLKKLLSRYYSDDFLHRRKMGFSPPIEKFLSADGNYRKILEARFLDSGCKIYEYFRPETIKKMIEQEQTNSLWLLLVLDEWLNQNI